MQLSDYAFNKLFPDEERELFDNKYNNDELMARQREGIYMYLMKSGQKCKFIWNDNEYEGRIIWRDGEYKILVDDEKVLDAEISEVDFLVEELDYK